MQWGLRLAVLLAQLWGPDGGSSLTSRTVSWTTWVDKVA